MVNKPGARRNENKLRDMSVVERYNKGGYKLQWNGKIGIKPFEDDEGKIRCETCERAWEFRAKGK